jgi:hypothetical protein
MQMDPLLANLKGHFPFHHVGPFLLVQVQGQGRPTGHLLFRRWAP